MYGPPAIHLHAAESLSPSVSTAVELAGREMAKVCKREPAALHVLHE